MNFKKDAPPIVREFLVYHETIKNHSPRTVHEYYLDLRNFFRFMKMDKGFAPDNLSLEEISINDIDFDFVSSVTLSDVYNYLYYMSHSRVVSHNSRNVETGISSNTMARKVATIRSFYKYLTKAKKLDENPLADLDSPKTRKSLPRYLTLDEAKNLLSSVSGRNKERDYCILMLFLNCGIRISELVSLNLADIRNDNLRVLGKGNKERVVFLNDACINALNDYLKIRAASPANSPALFITSRKDRISKAAVHSLVKKHIKEAGLDSSRYSAHKLRHTAATLMLHGGVDVRTLQELLGHENLNTTQIYTHVENDSLRQAALLSPLSGFNAETEDDE
ncbi:MAG: tyrosine recombinase XerC [Ruminococcaceae bacterium]|nr:tyrosine recombinase XerC [Oscillospiraceae bacterium]